MRRRGRRGHDRSPRAVRGTPAGRALPFPLLPAALVLAGLAACAGPEAGTGGDVVTDEGVPDMPAGYTVRLDDQAGDPGQFRIRPGEEPDAALRVTTGPAGIAWRLRDAVEEGPFTVRATFVQHAAPVGYREAYGLFVGGRTLDAPGQEYTYLLVRGTGDFMVKRRTGDATETVVDWTAHPAVAPVTEEGDPPRNVLAVEVAGDETRFLVNDAVVHRMPTTDARPWGIAGLRVNHRLDLEVEEWALEPLEAPGA